VPFTLLLQLPRERHVVRDVEPLEPGALLDLGELASAPARGVRGRVVGADGAPVPLARVTVAETWSSLVTAGHALWPLEVAARTDAKGWFRLSKVPSMPLRLRIDAEGHPFHLLVLGQDGDTLTLGRGGTLRGVVHGEGAVRLRVQLLAPHFHRDSAYEVYGAKAGAPFEIRLQPGTYAVSAYLDEGRRVAETEMTITEGDTAETVLRPR
jgi:hypothetical protein